MHKQNEQIYNLPFLDSDFLWYLNRMKMRATAKRIANEMLRPRARGSTIKCKLI